MYFNTFSIARTFHIPYIITDREPGLGTVGTIIDHSHAQSLVSFVIRLQTSVVLPNLVLRTFDTSIPTLQNVDSHREAGLLQFCAIC